MTQKKFVKKFMAGGFSRNEANKISIKSRESGVSYQKYYERKYQWLKACMAMGKAGNSLKNVGKAMNLMSSTVMSFNEAASVVATQ